MSNAFNDLMKRFGSYFKYDEDTDNKMKHKVRVMGELREAGFSDYQLGHSEVRQLFEIIENDEHVMAAIYGRVRLRGVAIIVATDKRVIYLDHIPFLDTLDEFNYMSISGISYSANGISWSVTIHTNLGDHTLANVKTSLAKKFTNYIESVCIDQPFGSRNISNNA